MEEQQDAGTKVRSKLAGMVVGFGLVGSALLGIGMIYAHAPDKRSDAATLALSSLLPLWGTWVGTVLAFYFARENFEAASRSTERLALLSIDKKLASIPVRQAMIPRSSILVPPVEEGKSIDDLPIAKILDWMGEKKIQRLPVLSGDAVRFVIHRSAFNGFLAREALKPGAKAEELRNYTITNLLDKAPDLRGLIEGSCAFVKESASLAEAKLAMESTPQCQDVFVTQSGKKDEPILGWITNNEIASHSKV